MADTFASLNVKLGKFQRELTDDRLANDIGLMSKSEAKKAASADLGGNDSFSGWSRRSPYPLATRYNIVGPGRVAFGPTRRSAGPWTVAQYGRNATAGPSLRTSSIGLSGNRKRAGKRYKRWNGVTAGKGTADDAIIAIEKRVPKMVQTHIPRALRKSGLL